MTPLHYKLIALLCTTLAAAIASFLFLALRYPRSRARRVLWLVGDWIWRVMRLPDDNGGKLVNGNK